jgi:hypothetical protein
VQRRVVQVGRKAKEEEDGSLGEGKRRKAMWYSGQDSMCLKKQNCGGKTMFMQKLQIPASSFHGEAIKHESGWETPIKNIDLPKNWKIC